MNGKRQFSLGYLLGEVALFALAMGLTRAVYLLAIFVAKTSPMFYPPPFRTDADLLLPMLALVTVSCWGAAFGGLFGKMRAGAISAFVGLLFLYLLLYLALYLLRPIP